MHCSQAMMYSEMEEKPWMQLWLLLRPWKVRQCEVILREVLSSITALLAKDCPLFNAGKGAVFNVAGKVYNH